MLCSVLSPHVHEKVYSREPKFPPAVPMLIIKLAIEYSNEDPSVGKIKVWRNHYSSDTETIGRRWTISSQRELAFDILTLNKSMFEVAMRWPKGNQRKEGAVISRRKFEEDTMIPSHKYVTHVLST